MTVTEMLERIGSLELSYWIAFIALRNKEKADANNGDTPQQEPRYFSP